MEYQTIQDLVEAAQAAGKKISEIVLLDQAAELALEPEEIFRRMDESFSVMLESVEKGQDRDLRSTSGLTGGDGYRMMHRDPENTGLLGSFADRAVARAIGVAEYNAAMGKIVAAPTAGSCGIMPGCLISMLEEKGKDRKDIVMSMFTAAAFGIVIAEKASISGASGGCQAECGSAAGMTAAALVEVLGGSPRQCADACAIALKNQLGLVCDPVAGLVEIPCIKRNAQGVVTAFCAADMAMAGIVSHIPADEVISAMGEIGAEMPKSLKETAKAGLATTPTGIRLRDRVFGEH